MIGDHADPLYSHVSFSVRLSVARTPPNRTTVPRLSAHVIADAHRKQIWTVNGIVPGTILIDGYVAGTWSIKQTKKTTALHIEAFNTLTLAERAEIEEEGESLLEFVAENAKAQDIKVSGP